MKNILISLTLKKKIRKAALNILKTKRVMEFQGAKRGSILKYVTNEATQKMRCYFSF